MLTFADLMLETEPKWLSKDLILLFYEGTDYSLAVKEFLDAYYLQSDNPFEQRIKGRCGYIRQSFPLIVENYDYHRISLMVDGVNQQTSDIDFYDQIR